MVHSSIENITEFIAKLQYKQIPEDAVKAAKNTILDWIGVTLAAKGEPAHKIAADYVRQIKAVRESSVVGGKLKTAAEFAAWVNGVSSHALDYDTTFSHGYNMHPTIAVLPAVLALGEKYHISGKELITSYIGGFEVLTRIGERIGESNSKAGWHPTSVIGTVASAVACGWILKMNTVQLKNAIGIASSMAGGLRENFGTMTKPMHAGNASKNAIVAALLAKNGFTANENILEGPFGFYNMFSNGQVNSVTEDDLGNRWDIISKGITFKLYPCCRGTHSGIDAALLLRSKHKINPDNIKDITLKTSPFTPKTLIHHRPKNELEAKFSLEYCVAAALTRGKVTMESFTDEAVNENRIQALLRKAEYAHPDGWPSGISLTQEVIITLENGTEYSHKVTVPRGDPNNPMTEADLLGKVRDCMAPFFKRRHIEKIIITVSSLESLDDISALMMLIS